MQPEFVDLDAAEYWITYALDLTADEHVDSTRSAPLSYRQP
jgi:hypothetical protein